MSSYSSNPSTPVSSPPPLAGAPGGNNGGPWAPGATQAHPASPHFPPDHRTIHLVSFSHIPSLISHCSSITTPVHQVALLNVLLILLLTVHIVFFCFNHRSNIYRTSISFLNNVNHWWYDFLQVIHCDFSLFIFLSFKKLLLFFFVFHYQNSKCGFA